MARRFFVSNDCIFDNQIKIIGAEHNHISRVLRLAVGENIAVSTYNGDEYECEIVEIKKDYTLANIQSKKVALKPDVEITLFQAIIKGEHMDWCVQKCTELGVTKIVPFVSNFTTVKQSDNKQERLMRVAIEACKQSGRSVAPKITEIISFNQVLVQLKEYEQIIVAFEQETAPAKDVISKLTKTKKVALIVGSEGGFSKDEIEQFIKLGAKSICMGKNILRAETASVALLSAVLYELGEWKNEK